MCFSLNSEDTHNTLKYANRAKEIKTKVTANVVSVNMHVSQYKKIIKEQSEQIADLKKILRQRKAEREAEKSAACGGLDVGLVSGTLNQLLKAHESNFKLLMANGLVNTDIVKQSRAAKSDAEAVIQKLGNGSPREDVESEAEREVGVGGGAKRQRTMRKQPLSRLLGKAPPKAMMGKGSRVQPGSSTSQAASSGRQRSARRVDTKGRKGEEAGGNGGQMAKSPEPKSRPQGAKEAWVAEPPPSSPPPALSTAPAAAVDTDATPAVHAEPETATPAMEVEATPTGGASVGKSGGGAGGSSLKKPGELQSGGRVKRSVQWKLESNSLVIARCGSKVQGLQPINDPSPPPQEEAEADEESQLMQPGKLELQQKRRKLEATSTSACGSDASAESIFDRLSRPKPVPKSQPLSPSAVAAAAARHNSSTNTRAVLRTLGGSAQRSTTGTRGLNSTPAKRVKTPSKKRSDGLLNEAARERSEALALDAKLKLAQLQRGSSDENEFSRAAPPLVDFVTLQAEHEREVQTEGSEQLDKENVPSPHRNVLANTKTASQGSGVVPKASKPLSAARNGASTITPRTTSRALARAAEAGTSPSCYMSLHVLTCAIYLYVAVASCC